MANTTEYTQMGGSLNVGNDPNDESVSQEEKDLRLAMALQQQENASAYDASRKRHEQTVAAQKTRTGRSSIGTSLPHIRKVQGKDNRTQGAGTGMYDAPGNDNDYTLAQNLQKEEQAALGTAMMVERMVKTDAGNSASKQVRNSRSGQSAFKK